MDESERLEARRCGTSVSRVGIGFGNLRGESEDGRGRDDVEDIRAFGLDARIVFCSEGY